MSELMDKILAAKKRSRQQLAALPFTEKIRLVEMMRDRSLLIAQNPLRIQSLRTTPVVVVSGSAVTPTEPYARTGGSMPLVPRQSPTQLNIPQNAEVEVAESSQRFGR